MSADPTLTAVLECVDRMQAEHSEMSGRLTKLESEKNEEREKRVAMEKVVGGLQEEVGGLREELRVEKSEKQSSPIVNAETLK